MASTAKSVKLTKAQERCLASVAAGTVYMHFDVYAGYWWVEGTYATKGRRTSESAAPAPISRLLCLELIDKGETTRPYSGHRLTPYVITPAGRLALAQSEGE